MPCPKRCFTALRSIISAWKPMLGWVGLGVTTGRGSKTRSKSAFTILMSITSVWGPVEWVLLEWGGKLLVKVSENI